MYCASPPGVVRIGCRKRGFAADDSPFPLNTKTFLPSPLNIAAVGYQPVGMKPATSLAPGLLMSTTATVLLSALATSRRLSSGDTLT